MLEAGLAASEADAELGAERWWILRALVLILRVSAAIVVAGAAWTLFQRAEHMTLSQIGGFLVYPALRAAGLAFAAELAAWMVHVAVHVRGAHASMRELLIDNREPRMGRTRRVSSVDDAILFEDDSLNG